MQGHVGVPGSGVDHLVQLLLHDASFARAVQQQDGHGAASAAVGLFKSHYKAFSAVLRPPAAYVGAAVGAAPDGSPTFRRAESQGPRRLSDTGGGGSHRPDIRIKDRVIIHTNHKKFEGNLIGKEGVVLNVTSNGWVKLQVGSDTLDVQMRFLTPVHNRVPSALVGSTSLAATGLKGPRGAPRKSEVVKQVRKELTQLEEQVPWKEVQDRWRTQRKGWTRRLRQADSPRDVAICVRELHDNLRTDKTSGLFAAGGAWEAALRECITSGNHLQLQQVWEEMRAALQSWLAAGQLPGGLAALDKASYAQAVQTYQVLQEAAIRGPEFLEQVPLDQILTSHKELLALQHIIQREATVAHSRLQAISSGGGSAAAAAAAAPGAAAAPPGAAASAGAAAVAAAATPGAAAPGGAQAPAATAAPGGPVFVPDFEQGGGLTESVLQQLGKLPRIKAHEGAPSDVDTDRDAGSEATDLEPDDMLVDAA